MFEPPDTPVDNLARYADWVELCALFSDGNNVARADVADVAKDSGLIQPIKTDLFPGDVDFAEPDSLSPEDVGQHFAELIWEQLQRRADLLGERYPFTVADYKLERTAEWKTT